MILINPITALIIFLLAVLLLIFVFWPKKGILSQIKKSQLNSKRVLIEDSLKHLYDYESHKLNATLNSIAGNLGISTDKTSRIIQHLKKMNLVKMSDHSLELTPHGREYALRVIRIHRLWENYLAEETGLSELEWHDEAEKVEHILSMEDADILSARMGNPRFDPHGDPIPTTEGQIYEQKGILLNTAKTGKVAKIIHIEDEPKSIYQQILDQGLYPGKEIKILKNNENETIIAADGEERIFTPIIASKVSVELLADKVFDNKKQKTLIDLEPGEIAEVLSVAPNCRGQQRRRLLDFGIVPGASISIHMSSPLNDPVAYLVKDTIVALRKNQAEKVLIN